MNLEISMRHQIEHLEKRVERLLECNQALSDTNGKLAFARVTMETERDALLSETMSDKWYLKAQAMECDLEEARETIKKLEADRLPFAEAYAAPEVELRKAVEWNRAEWEKRAAKAEAALRHISEYPNITATAMRDCAREALRAAGVALKPLPTEKEYND